MVEFTDEILGKAGIEGATKLYAIRSLAFIERRNFKMKDMYGWSEDNFDQLLRYYYNNETDIEYHTLKKALLFFQKMSPGVQLRHEYLRYSINAAPDGIDKAVDRAIENGYLIARKVIRAHFEPKDQDLEKLSKRVAELKDKLGAFA